MKIVGVLLAAGNSSRFGSDKLAYPLNSGEKLGFKSAHGLKSELNDCIAVVRKDDLLFINELTRLGFKTVIQPNPDEGMGNSLALGVREASEADGWLIALADMPWIKSETLRQIISSLEHGAPIITPVFNGQRGHPVGFNKQFRDQLVALNGDTGGKQLLRTHAQLVQSVKVDDPGILRDVDLPEDLDSTEQHS